jgi:hypothetical protein
LEDDYDVGECVDELCDNVEDPETQVEITSDPQQGSTVRKKIKFVEIRPYRADASQFKGDRLNMRRHLEATGLQILL